MSQEDLVKRSLAALWKGTSVGGIATTVAKGCTATRTSTGLCPIALDPSPSMDASIDSTQCSMDLVLYTTQVMGSVADTSGTVKTVNLTSLVTPTAVIDAAFEVKIYRIYPGS